MQNLVRNYPRWFQSYLRRILPGNKLWLLSPTQANDTQWRYGVTVNGKTYLLGKPVKSRDMGRSEAPIRFGMKASELKPKAQRKAA